MRHKVLGIFLALYSFAVVSASTLTLQEFLLTELDPKIGQALMAKNKMEIEKALGKATLTEGPHIYYELEGFKYAFSAIVKNGKITHTYYHPKKTKLTLQDFELKKLEGATIIESSKIRPLEDGLSYEYIEKKSGIRLVFQANSERSLSTIEVTR